MQLLLLLAGGWAAGGWCRFLFSNVRCMRSCLSVLLRMPLRAMRSGTIPSLIHHTPPAAIVPATACESERRNHYPCESLPAFHTRRKGCLQKNRLHSLSVFRFSSHRLAAPVKLPAVGIRDGWSGSMRSPSPVRKPALEIGRTTRGCIPAHAPNGCVYGAGVQNASLRAHHPDPSRFNRGADGAGHRPVAPPAFVPASRMRFQFPRSPSGMCALSQFQHLLFNLLRWSGCGAGARAWLCGKQPLQGPRSPITGAESDTRSSRGNVVNAGRVRSSSTRSDSYSRINRSFFFHDTGSLSTANKRPFLQSR